MLVHGSLKEASMEAFTLATRPNAADFPYRFIWVTDVGLTGQVQISNGAIWIGAMNTAPRGKGDKLFLYFNYT